MEDLGITLVVIGSLAAMIAAGVLLGWPWALVVGSVLAIAAGVILIRTAALTPPKPEKPEGGEAS